MYVNEFDFFWIRYKNLGLFSGKRLLPTRSRNGEFVSPCDDESVAVAQDTQTERLALKGRSTGETEDKFNKIRNMVWTLFLRKT